MAYPLDQVIDFTPLIELEPTLPTLIDSLDLFSTEYHATDNVELARQSNSDSVIPARERGGERNWNAKSNPDWKVVKVPFFPLDHNIKAADVQSFRTYADPTYQGGLRTPEEVIQRYTADIRRKQALTKERILSSAVQGFQYVGSDAGNNFSNQNYNYNWYDVWGQTQRSIAIDFASTTVNPATVIEAEGRAYIEDEKGDGSTSTTIIALCGRNFFANLVGNAFVQASYQFYMGTPNILRDRVGGNNDVRAFDYMGVTYMVDPHNNIGADEAYLIPQGIPQMFQAHYAPADHVDYANTVAQDSYMFMLTQGRTIQLQSEFSLLAANTRPELVVKLTTA